MHGFRAHPQRGFNIIEVMMAAAILLVGFIGLIQAVTIGSESLDTARKQQIAVQIAAAEIEKLRGGAWSAVTSLPAEGSISVNGAGVVTGNMVNFALTNHTASLTDDNTDLVALARGFTCSFTRTYLRPASASASTATFVKVVYTVTWITNTNRVQRHQIDAYFSKSGLHLSYQQS